MWFGMYTLITWILLDWGGLSKVLLKVLCSSVQNYWPLLLFSNSSIVVQIQQDHVVVSWATDCAMLPADAPALQKPPLSGLLDCGVSMPAPILPPAVPDLKEVKAFANHLHSLGKYWSEEIFWMAGRLYS